MTFVALLLLCFLTPIALALNFAVIGDWGMGGYKTGWWPEIRSAQALNQICEELQCNFTLSCGDNIYVGNVWVGLRDSFEGMFTSPGPFFPSIGNHDNAGPQMAYTKADPRKRWRFPSPYYTYKLPLDNTGYTVQLFAVNSQAGDLAGGGQYAWLESELNRTDARWKFIFCHYPSMGSGRHRRVGTVRSIHYLMEKYNAQGFFVGHDHIVEVSNLGGRVLGLSGGMARGGMMTRGIGGPFRRFTLTQPSEFNGWPQDWPGHGLITVRLSPNVLNLQVWDQYQAIQYDFSVSWDWMKQPKVSSQAHVWPPPEVILQARKDEVDLPKGPGGHTTDFSNMGPPPAVPVGPAPVGPAPKVSEIPINLVTTSPERVVPVPSYIMFAVSSECATCTNPRVGVPFSIYISGAAVDSNSRIYLTTSPLGCNEKSNPFLVLGTKITSPDEKYRNTFFFNASGPSRVVYVCYSVNMGRNYGLLSRADVSVKTESFILETSDGIVPETEAPSGGRVQSGVPTSAPGSGSNNNGLAADTNSVSGHSTMAIVLVGLLCSVAGSIGAVFVSKSMK